MILVTKKNKKNAKAKRELLSIFRVSVAKKAALKQNYSTLEDCLILMENDMYHLIRKKPINKKQIKSFKKWFWKKMFFEALRNGNLIEFYYSGILFKTLPERIRFVNKIYNKELKKSYK